MTDKMAVGLVTLYVRDDSQDVDLDEARETSQKARRVDSETKSYLGLDLLPGLVVVCSI